MEAVLILLYYTDSLFVVSANYLRAFCIEKESYCIP